MNADGKGKGLLRFTVVNTHIDTDTEDYLHVPLVESFLCQYYLFPRPRILLPTLLVLITSR
jgi:hypothetical protein